MKCGRSGHRRREADGDVYWCVTRGPTATVYRSDDGARTWRRLSRGLRAADVRNFAVAPSDPRRLYVTARRYYERNRGVFAGGVYRSDDGGRTWTSLNGAGLTCRHVTTITIDPHQPTRLYLGTGGNGVFVGEAPP